MRIGTVWKQFAAMALLFFAMRPLYASIPGVYQEANDCVPSRRTAAIKPSAATDAFEYDQPAPHGSASRQAGGLGNWTTYTNAEGRVYRMAYDALGRLVAATNALGHQVFANRYDPAGNVTNRTDGAGNTIAYAYDELNRLVSLQGGAGVPPASFSHDPVGNLLTASNDTAYLSFAYDAMDRLTSAATSLSNATYNVTYRRDAGGLVTNLVYASGKAVARAYDPDGRLASVSDWLGHTWTFAWDGAGKPTGGTAPGGIVATNHYDAAGRLSFWSVGSLAGRTITRDLAGRKTRDDITAGPHPVPSFVRYAENTFDAADRLTSASVRYGSHTNAAVAETYLYDGNGALTNLVSGSNAVFAAAYDPLGQLSSWRSLASLAVDCSYDALGNRVVASDRLWLPDHADPLKRPLIEADATTGEPIRYYLWGPGRLLGFIDAASGALTVAHCDEYGSVVALTDASGAVLHTAYYGPNGQDWGTTGTNPTPFAWLGGHGVQRVAVSDHLGPLYLTRYRLYSASLNRFLSSDPLGLAGGLNLYAYAEGDPLSYIDPLGLGAEEKSGGWQGFLTRLGGLGQMLGGTAEAAAGYTFGTVTSPTVVGGILGAAVGTHGIDNVQAGARQLWTGQQVDAMTSGLLQSAGLSRQTANTVNAVVSVAATLGTSAANMAATTPPASFADDFVMVSRWGREGLQPGDFVMKGDANYANYIKSGKWQPGFGNEYAPFSSGQTYTVPTSALSAPSKAATANAVADKVFSPIKQVLGQRSYWGD